MNKLTTESSKLAFELADWFDFHGARFTIHDYAGLIRCAKAGESEVFLTQLAFLCAQQSVKFPHHLSASLLKAFGIPTPKARLAGKRAVLPA